MKNDFVICKTVSRRKGHARACDKLYIISVLKCTKRNDVNAADSC